MGVDREDAEFAAELARLKRAGSAVLVREDGAGRGICTALQGSEEEYRRRVLVRTADADVLPVPPRDATIVDVTPRDTRSVATSGCSAFDLSAVDRRLDPGADVDALATAVVEVVDRVGEDVQPGELRVCLGRLSPLLSREGDEAVGAAVETVMDRVRERRGMGHAHLSTAVPDAVERAFDVTVETRRTATGDREQRWYLHGAGLDTGWLRQ